MGSIAVIGKVHSHSCQPIFLSDNTLSIYDISTQNIVLTLGKNTLAHFKEHVREIRPKASLIECSFEPLDGSVAKNKYLHIPFGSELEVISEFAKDKKIVGIINTKDHYESLHGTLVDFFKLPGPSSDSISRISNKARMHALVRELQLQHFRPTTISCPLSQAREMLQRVQFPVVIKPFVGAHSRAVHKLSTIDDFGTVHRYLEQHFVNERGSQVLGTHDATVLIEEYIEGKQVAPVCYVDRHSKVHILSLVRCRIAREFGLDHMQVLYRTTPSEFSEEVVQKIKFVLQKIATQTKLSSTFLDPEFIVSGKKVFLIEINVRLGGFRQQLFADAYGINLHKQIARLALGKEIDDTFAWTRSATACEVWESHSGMLTKVFVPKSKYLTVHQPVLKAGQEYLAPPDGNKPVSKLYLASDELSFAKLKSLRERVVVEFER